MEYILYILYSDRHNIYYIGHTNNIERRLREHNDSKQKGWTRSYQPWSLVYTEKFVDRGGAISKEKYLKSLKSKIKIKEYIAG